MWETQMFTPAFLGTKPFFGIIFALMVAAGTGYVYYNGGLSTDLPASPPQWKPGGVHGAPGPLMGATGLPLLVAYCVYRLVRRRRKAE
ncbi:hypothetical protein NWI01_27040 [Nitrobacter winogradskyi]|uniref:Uncharacterized protein n=2 Tax=Nitrobacter winogradskyi TaxID=913 RepID=A0A4Y3WCQ8_NITWI|nr:hypothetical protein NWI01_27040 [Nitrobacter winogradskyi]